MREVRVGAPISRIELSKRTGISKPAVTRGVAGLIDDGLLVETSLGAAGSTGGRRPRMLELVPTAAAGLGCMIKVGRVVGAIGGFDGRIERREAVDFDPLGDPREAVEKLVDVLAELSRENPPDRPILAVGVSVPGLVDEIGRVITVPHMPGWRGLRLATLLEEEARTSRLSRQRESRSGDCRGVVRRRSDRTQLRLPRGRYGHQCRDRDQRPELWRGTHSLAGEMGHATMTATAHAAIAGTAAAGRWPPPQRSC